MVVLKGIVYYGNVGTVAATKTVPAGDRVKFTLHYAAFMMWLEDTFTNATSIDVEF